MNDRPCFPYGDTLHRWIAPGVFFVLSWTAIAGQSEPGPPDLPATGFRDFSIAQYDYLDDGTRLTEAEILDAFLLSDLSVRAFYREASYNLLDMDLVELVDGITDLHPPQADCYPSVSNVLIEVDEELEPDPYWPDIDQHLALVNNDCYVNSSTFGNQVGFPTLSQGVQYLQLAWTTEKPYPPGDFAGLSQSTWAPEIGHGLGIPMHSQAYKCFVNGPLSVNRDDCVNTRHQHDLMGLRHAATHLNGHFKDHFGWMPEANKTTIHSDGCHVIDLHDLAQPADPGQTQFVEISLPHDVPAGTAGGSEIDFDVVTLEFRGHTGFDRRSFKLVPLADGGFRDVTAEVNAFLPDFWDPIDGYLLEGETWEVRGNPMKITVLDTIDAPESMSERTNVCP